MLNDRSSALALLQTRRSGRPRDLIEPGPDAAQLREMVAIAARTPDHGKLAPWRFVHVPGAVRASFHRLLDRAFRETGPAPSRLELDAIERLAFQAPTLIVALFRPIVPHKIPVWEQQLSCGAAIMNLLSAAHAMGFAAGWITGWAAYAPAVIEAFGAPGDRIAGFVFIGTPAIALEERPRPDLTDILSDWPGG